MTEKPSDPSSSAPSPGPLKKGRCPRCGETFEYVRVADYKPFPFCSSRCRDIDLGKWMSGAYAIPGAPISDEEQLPDERDDDGT